MTGIRGPRPLGALGALYAFLPPSFPRPPPLDWKVLPQLLDDPNNLRLLFPHLLLFAKYSCSLQLVFDILVAPFGIDEQPKNQLVSLILSRVQDSTFGK